MRKLAEQDLYDILLGSTIISTGGGGDYHKGYELLKNTLSEGYSFEMAYDSEILRDELVGTPYGCGSISPFTEKQQAEYDKMEKIEVTPESAAMKVLEKYFDKEFYGVIATELGGYNTAVALDVAARLGKPIIDADPAGRAVPCLQHTTYYLKNIPIGPMGLANQFGDELVIAKVLNDERAEAITRAIAVASFNLVGVVDHPGKWEDIRKGIHLGTLSWCLEIGKAAREEKLKGNIYTDRIIRDFDGYKLFEGEITSNPWEDKDGFTLGEMTIKGTGDYENDILKIWYQNENIVSWYNDEPFVLSPDLINLVDCNKNMPIQNPSAEIGTPVHVFGLKCRPEWRSELGIEILGPKFFGFDFDYKAIEEVVK